MSTAEYDDLDATALAALVRERVVHPRELVATAIARAEARNPALNAIIHTQFERALADAERVDIDRTGPFPGVPFLLKDYNGQEAGEPYHMGCRALRDVDYRPPVDSAYARRVRDGGLIPIGRTNVPELASMGSTEPALYGPTHNPWDLTRSPGGSSGGAGAAVAAQIVPVAHANDISGSIRIPAAHCGVVGLKPTRGRVVMSGADSPLGMTVEGVLTRSVRDTAAMVDWLATTSPWWPAPPLRRPLADELGAPLGALRVGVWTEAFNGSVVDAECAGAATRAGELLASMGCRVDVAAPTVLSDQALWDDARDALAVAASAESAAWEPRIGRALGETDLEPRTWGMVAAGRSISAPALYALIERFQAYAARALAWFDDYDLLVTPTVAAPPGALGDYLNRYVSGLGSAFTRPINVTGQPAISIPLGWPADGLPRGVQLVAGYGRDDLVVRVASALESAAPWAGRRPAGGA
jgi:amidase